MPEAKTTVPNLDAFGFVHENWKRAKESQSIWYCCFEILKETSEINLVNGWKEQMIFYLLFQCYLLIRNGMMVLRHVIQASPKRPFLRNIRIHNGAILYLRYVFGMRRRVSSS